MKKFNTDTKKELWKLTRGYDFNFCLFLVRDARGKINDLATAAETGRFEEKINILKQLGIKKISYGPCKLLLTKNCSPYAVHRALLARRTEVDKYISRYKKKFETELSSRETQITRVSQLELQFKEYITVGDLASEYRISREDVAYEHLRNRS